MHTPQRIDRVCHRPLRRLDKRAVSTIRPRVRPITAGWPLGWALFTPRQHGQHEGDQAEADEHENDHDHPGVKILTRCRISPSAPQRKTSKPPRIMPPQMAGSPDEAGRRW